MFLKHIVITNHKVRTSTFMFNNRSVLVIHILAIILITFSECTKQHDTRSLSESFMKLNLKQTATTDHICGKKEAMAEPFTQMEYNRTHWSMGPSDLKPYANQAFCDGIKRIMLHQAR
jgi:hypothetical protein